jgi:hypothetical protein
MNGAIACYSELSFLCVLGRAANKIAIPATSASPPRIGGNGFALCSSVACIRNRTGDMKYASETIPRTIKMIPTIDAAFTKSPCCIGSLPGAVRLADLHFSRDCGPVGLRFHCRGSGLRKQLRIYKLSFVALLFSLRRAALNSRLASCIPIICCRVTARNVLGATHTDSSPRDGF